MIIFNFFKKKSLQKFFRAFPQVYVYGFNPGMSERSDGLCIFFFVLFARFYLLRKLQSYCSWSHKLYTIIFIFDIECVHKL